jgi:hypothetical protein
MDSATVTAVINLVTALLPTIEAGAVALIADVQQLLATANASTDATPEQLATVQQLIAASDAAQDKAFAAYEAMKAAAQPAA